MKRQGLEDEDLSDKMRLDKLLALLGEGTRSEIKAMVRAGRVTVDGRAAKDAGMQVCGETDDIRLDGRALYYKAVRHVMLNKPSGVLTAARDKKQKTVMDLLPPMYAAMGAMPAGRLDKDTEGLLVITSDGQLAHRIISPKHEVGKVYYARLDGELTDEDVAALEAGIHIRDADGEFDARPAQIDRDGGDAAYIRVTEGKYHQVKRMFAARGKQVVYLKRMAIGGLALDPDLQPGEWPADRGRSQAAGTAGRRRIVPNRTACLRNRHIVCRCKRNRVSGLIRTRTRETGAFFGEKGQRTVRSAPTTFFQQ